MKSESGGIPGKAGGKGAQLSERHKQVRIWKRSPHTSDKYYLRYHIFANVLQNVLYISKYF